MNSWLQLITISNWRSGFMIPALYLEKIQERKLPSKAEKLLAVNDEGTMLITFNNNFHNVLNIHEIQNEQIVSNKITFDEDLFLSRYFKYVDEQEIAPNTVKINSRNNEKHIFYVVNSEADKIVKVSVDAPLVGQQMNSTAQASTPLTDITNSTIIEYHPISDRIRDTAIHPTENSLFVLTLDNLFILEENKTIELNLTGYGDYTTHHVQSDLIVIEENAEVYYYAFFKIKIDGRFGEDFDMKVRKIHEIVYANKYESREELNVPLQFYSFMQKIDYDERNKIFGVTTSGNQWDYYTIFFNENLQKLQIHQNYRNSTYILMFFSQQQNTMFMIKDFCKTCSKTPGCYNKFSIENKIITIEEPDKCYSQPFEREWYEFYNLLGEVNIKIDNNTQSILYTQNFIFNEKVTDNDIYKNENPNLYYQNRYFFEPNLQKNPYDYSFKNQNNLINLEPNSLSLYELKTQMVQRIDGNDDDGDNNPEPVQPPSEESFQAGTIVIIVVGGGNILIFLVLLIMFLILKKYAGEKQDPEDNEKVKISSDEIVSSKMKEEQIPKS